LPTGSIMTGTDRPGVVMLPPFIFAIALVVTLG
jgi:hypothetical protein